MVVPATTKFRDVAYRSDFVSAGRIVAVVCVVALAALVSTFGALLILMVALGAVAATARPTAAMVGVPIMVALLPTYWAPNVPGTQVALAAAVGACIVLLPAALRLRHEFQFMYMDKLVVALVLFETIAFLVNAQQGRIGLVASAVLTVALPYATFRLLGLQADNRAAAAVGLVLGGLASALIAIREYDGWPNPFFHLFPHGSQHAFWARADERFGRLRPEAAFGHAIALGMFLVFAAVLAIGLVWTARERGRGRYWNLAAAAVILFALNRTLVRGPIVMFIVALLVFVMGESRSGRTRRAIFVALGLVILANFVPLTNLAYLRDATFGAGRVRESGDYRLEIWEIMRDPANFSLFGHPPTDQAQSGYTHSVGTGVGIKSFDNGYAKVYFSFGIFGLIAFVLLLVRAVRAATLPKLLALDRAWVAALAGCAVALVTVDLLTQFTHFFWFTLGIVAAIVQRTGATDPEDAALLAPAAGGLSH